MSAAAMKWAKRQMIQDGALQNVVHRLAQYASDGGSAFPSQDTLAKDCGLSDRSIRRALALLEKLGVITRHARSKGRAGRTTDMITLALHRDFDLSRKAIQKARERVVAATFQPDTVTVATGQCVQGITTVITTLPIQRGDIFNVEGLAQGQPTPTDDRPSNVIPFPGRAA